MILNQLSQDNILIYISSQEYKRKKRTVNRYQLWQWTGEKWVTSLMTVYKIKGIDLIFPSATQAEDYKGN